MKLKSILNIKKYPFYFKILKNGFFPVSYKKSYSQLGEDLIIDFIFKNLKIQKPTYLDIGTNHPIKINNTYLFYKQGSTGVCIEPNPELCKIIKNKRKKDTVLNIGIGKEEKTNIDFFMMNTDVLSTFSKEEVNYLIKNTKQTLKEIIKVPLKHIDNILQDNFNGEAPNFLSLDTEGFDFEILKSINFKKVRPEIICVETLTYTENRTERKEIEVIDFMKEVGYFVYADTYINTIFVDKQKWLNR